MMKYFLLLLLILLMGKLNAQTFCDSVYITPNVVYITQSIDSAVFVEVTHTGQRDASYSTCSFKFPDSSNIDINSIGVTNGIAGPFTYVPPNGYKIIYNNPNIPANTVVNAFFNLYHSGAPIDCDMPITFIINATTGITNTSTAFNVSFFPNPVNGFLNVESGAAGFDVSIFDLSGRRVFSKKFTGNSSIIDINDLSGGVYVIVMKNKLASFTKKIVKLK